MTLFKTAHFKLFSQKLFFLYKDEVFMAFCWFCLFPWNQRYGINWRNDWSQAHRGSWGRQTDRGIWERRRWRRGWNRSFYMLSGFNLVRAIILQFTEVANQMSVCMCALGVCVSFVYPNLLKRWALRLCSCYNHLTLFHLFLFAFLFFF